jgi:predicted nucleotidyltransferase
MSLEQGLAQIAQTFDAIELMVLFGSAATGRLARESDVDVGVLLDAVSPEVRRRIEVALGRAAGRAIDLVDLVTAPPQLRFEIARDGRVLLERRPHLWADFRARAMIDWWDWGPTARWIHAAAARRLGDQVSDGPS